MGENRSEPICKPFAPLPSCENAYIFATGPEIGTRESRHVNALYQVTTQDVENGAHFDDVVCLETWPIS